MQILITGATGFIGSAVAEAVAKAGHAVHGLAQSPAAVSAIAGSGWVPVPGDVRAAAELESVAAAYDAVIHVANTGGSDAGAVDRAATLAILRALDGTRRHFIYTSGIWVVGAGRTDESSAVNPAELVAWRGQLERDVLAAAPGVAAVVLRPAIVYGRGGGIPGMVARGELPVIAPGTQHWPLVHVDDLADLYVRALRAPAGSVLHGVATRLTMRELAVLAAAGTAEFPQTVAIEEARARFGPFADALALDQDPSSTKTRELLGWNPRAASPVEEFLFGSYRGGGALAGR